MREFWSRMQLAFNKPLRLVDDQPEGLFLFWQTFRSNNLLSENFFVLTKWLIRRGRKASPFIRKMESLINTSPLKSLSRTRFWTTLWIFLGKPLPGPWLPKEKRLMKLPLCDSQHKYGCHCHSRSRPPKRREIRIWRTKLSQLCPGEIRGAQYSV